LTVTFADPQALLASILSVLAMTYSDNGKRDTLYYRLLSEGKSTNNLEKDEKTLEQEKLEDEAGESRKFTAEQLQDAAKDCVDFFMKHNAEADAVDLLMEVESIKKLPEWTDDRTYARVCQYLVR
jgi:26S proteasome regulatory subunit N1